MLLKGQRSWDMLILLIFLNFQCLRFYMGYRLKKIVCSHPHYSLCKSIWLLIYFEVGREEKKNSDQAIAIVTELCETNRLKQIHSEIQRLCLLLLQTMVIALYLNLVSYRFVELDPC